MKINIPFLFVMMIILVMVPMHGSTQQRDSESGAETDPAATELLDRVSQHIRSFKTYEMQFDFEYSFPGMEKSNARGTIIQQGKKYRFEMGPQLVVCDGQYVWIYLRERNEVQINDLDPQEVSGLTPEYFLSFYSSGDYTYAITGEQVLKNGNKRVRIDFKPKDEFTEYAKIGIDVDVKNSTPEALVAIGRDGSRYVFTGIRLKAVNPADPAIFKFDASKYPNISIEDLRLD